MHCKQLQVVRPKIAMCVGKERTMIRKLAYWIVYSDLKQVSLFRGIYDAKYGDKHYMYGIWSVMEFIAHNISEDFAEDLNNTFVDNLIMSCEKTERNNNGESEN